MSELEPCIMCGALFPPRPPKKTCSPVCSNMLTRERHRESVRRQRERKRMVGQSSDRPWTPEGRAKLARIAAEWRDVRTGIRPMPDAPGRRNVTDAWRRTDGLEGWARLTRTARLANEPVAVVISVLRSQGERV